LVRAALSFFLFALPVSAQDDPAAKKAADDFKAKIKDTKSFPEKAKLIFDLAELQPRDKAYAKAIGPLLNAHPQDLNYVVPLAAADALARFRGNATAAQVLAGTLPTTKKTPFLYNRILLALGKVGHAVSFQTFDEILKGTDGAAAEKALEACVLAPGSMALDFLFKHQERLDKERKGANEAMTAFITRIEPKIVEAIQDISGEKYPTMKEMQLWWSKRGAQFKEGEAEREKAAAAAPPPPRLPVPILEFRFGEENTTATANSGTASGHYPTATMTANRPVFAGTQVPNAGPRCVDFGAKAGPHAVDVGGGAGLEHLKNLKSFTICGWINVRDLQEGAADKMAGAGNRILSWMMPGKDGVDLVQRADGTLQLGVNQWADQSTAKSGGVLLTKADETVENGLQNNWRFVAVTYDSTSASAHVKFYLGDRTKDAKANGTADYARGPAGAKIAPCASIGNAPPMVRGAGDRMFRGLVDDLRVYGSTQDGSGALPEDVLVKIQDRQTRQNRAVAR
jgi:hypothetical protein